MGSTASTVAGTFSWHQCVQYLSRPPVLTAAILVVATAAWVFSSFFRKRGPRGGYGCPATGSKAGNNEITHAFIVIPNQYPPLNYAAAVMRHRYSPDKEIAVFPESPETDTLHAILVNAAHKRPNAKAAGFRPVIQTVKETKKVNGEDKVWEFPQLGSYEWLSYSDVLERVEQFGSALAAIGLQRGGLLGLFEETRFEWTMAAQGAWRQGFTVLTVYANLGEEALTYALGLGEVSVLLLNGKGLSIIAHAIEHLPKLKTLIYVDGADPKYVASLKSAGVTSYPINDFLDLGKKKFIAAAPARPEDLAMIMFTSGTTGMPKGVMLTHRQVVGAISGACEVLVKALHLNDRDVYISYLPLAHILALVVHSAIIHIGCAIGYGSPRTLTDSAVRNCRGDLRELTPTLFVGVPTVYERIKAGVERKIRASPVTNAVFNFAFSAKKFLQNWGLPGSALLNLIVFNKLRHEVGGNIRIFVSGGAALSHPVQDFIETAFCTRTIQGYGLTETCGPACVQELDDMLTGSVGAPIPSCSIKLVDVPEMGYSHESNPPRGEIWIKGVNVGVGYYKNPEETNKAFIDGWFRTGDVGEWTSSGTLKIIDRIKNLIKPPHGEYIALENIEARYRNCEFVEHILVYVDSLHNDIVAVVSPQKLALENWAHKNGIESNDVGVICNDSKAINAVLKSLQATARTHKLKSIETVRAVHLTADEWTPDNDMLTAAQKLKRANVTKAYRKEIDAMYDKLASSNNSD